MRKKRIFSVFLALIFVFTSAQFTFAKDVTGEFNKKTPNINANNMVFGKFEKKTDMDAYTFVSGGGSYKLVIYTKTPAVDEFMVDINEAYDMDENVYIFPAEVFYGPFDYFSAAAGDPASYQWTVGTSYSSPEAVPYKNGWYRTVIKIGKYKRNAKIGIRFDASAKCSYKFKIEGKNSPAPAKAVLKGVTGKKKAAKVKWKKVSGAKGYQIQYSKDKDFKSGIKSTLVKGGSTLSKTVKISKKGTYFFRVRAYKKVTDVKVYGKWSTVKKGKVK